MDFSIIYQLRTKKFWWMDVILYFAVSLLVATVFCYFIFMIKSSVETQQIKKASADLLTVGTDEQKAQEQEVLSYKTKISDFNDLLTNHEFASNVFAFMQQQTLPYVWFKQFNLDQKNAAVQLSGQVDNMDDLSRQVNSFETNQYVEKVSLLSSAIDENGKTDFNISLSLDPKIFSYISDQNSLQSLTGQQNPAPVSGQSASDESQSGNAAAAPVMSSANLITSFDLSSPSVEGQINQQNFSVVLNVPAGTDTTKLTPSITTSPFANVSPSSGSVQDISNPVVYQVTAQNGTVQNYTVSTNVLPQSSAKSGGNLILVLLIVLVLLVVIIAAVIFFILKKPKPKED